MRRPLKTWLVEEKASAEDVLFRSLEKSHCCFFSAFQADIYSLCLVKAHVFPVKEERVIFIFHRAWLSFRHCLIWGHRMTKVGTEGHPDHWKLSMLKLLNFFPVSRNWTHSCIISCLLGPLDREKCFQGKSMFNELVKSKAAFKIAFASNYSRRGRNTSASSAKFYLIYFEPQQNSDPAGTQWKITCVLFVQHLLSDFKIFGQDFSS